MRGALVAVALVAFAGCDFNCDVQTGKPPKVSLKLRPPAPAAPFGAGAGGGGGGGAVPSAAGSVADAPVPSFAAAPSPAPPPPPPPPRPAPKLPSSPLRMSFEGKALPIKRAWAYTRAGESYFVIFATDGGKRCPGTKWVSRDGYHLSTVLHRDMKSLGGHWRSLSPTMFLRKGGLRSRGLRDPADYPASVKHAPRKKGDTLQASVDMKVAGMEAVGAFSAVYCGDEKDLPPPASFPGVKAELGGETIAIRGALIRLQDDMVRLRLSSQGSRCEALSAGSDTTITFAHTRDIGQLTFQVSGHRHPLQRAVVLGKGIDGITFTHPADLTPGKRVRATFAYQGDVRGMPANVKGEVDALVCPRL